MEELQIFNNSEFGTVRGIETNGEPWFIGKDVAEALGYQNVSKALSDHVDDEDKGITKCYTLGGLQEMLTINESGVYSLVFSSKLPNAKKFKHWVTSEVLPAIRKHHVYALDDMLNDPDVLITALQAYKTEREQKLALQAENKALESQVAVKDQQIAELQPKASYYDIVINSPDLISTTAIAKDYGWSAYQMNKFLNSLGIQYKLGDIWLLYQKYAEQGYTNTKTHAYPASDGNIHTAVHTYWTQKGRLFIYDTLKAQGIVPVMERPRQLELPPYDFGGIWS